MSATICPRCAYDLKSGFVTLRDGPDGRVIAPCPECGVRHPEPAPADMPRPIGIPIATAIDLIAERSGCDLCVAAEQFRADAYAGEFEVRGRPHLMANGKLVIPRELWTPCDLLAPWGAALIHWPPYGTGFHFGAGTGTHWCDAEMRQAVIDRLWPPLPPIPLAGPAARRARSGPEVHARGYCRRAASEDEDGAVADLEKGSR